MDTLRAIFTNEIFIQAIGFVGMTMGLIATQCKSYQNISRFRILGSLIFGIQFIFLGGYTGAGTNIVSCAGNLTYGACKSCKARALCDFTFQVGEFRMAVSIDKSGTQSSGIELR